MSVRVSSWAWHQELDDPSAKLLLLKLADSASDDGVCWPSQRTLATHCGLNERSIRYKLDALTKAGLVSVIRNRYADGRLAGNVYQLAAPSGSPLPVGQRQPVASASGNPLPVTSGSPLPDKNRNYEPSHEPLGATASADAVWDSLVLLFGDPSNENTRGKRNRAVKLIKESLNGGFVGDDIRAAEIAKRAAQWEEIFPGASFTDMGFANQWDALIPPRSAGPDPVRIQEDIARENRLAEEALALPPEEQAKKLRELMNQVKGVVKEVPR